MINHTDVINRFINHVRKESDEEGSVFYTDDISDGYHTFGELYEHRFELYIALCMKITFGLNKSGGKETNRVWRSLFHSNGSGIAGWFLLGIDKEPGKQITYHLPLSKWEVCHFAETLDKAPEFDGHTSDDVLERIKNL